MEIFEILNSVNNINEKISLNTKVLIRDLNINMIGNNLDIKLDTKHLHNGLLSRIILPNKKTIKYVSDIGGVLTGSRAIRCYNFNNRILLNRKSNDWDFIINKEMAFKVCDKFNINWNFNKESIINISKNIWTSYGSYGGITHIGKVDVNLLVKENLPEYNQAGKMKIATLNYCINQKYKLIEDLSLLKENMGYLTDRREIENQISKHRWDLNEILIKFNAIKN